ncbi:TadE/TadG family type IV pilus assembly protein [Azospirillum picis]|uniref:Flp pilus assembly protein TadG n=1 Tax=Azospirillum picis TaxID=488438 RepID=A0ABU0MNA0_9PROT|nr:TadE/TadG family type IV pilus assembly protein [Azospirillum picis]MBP2301106.1 Flp pilus assembly protein TadG [Azospirillum picis]MDQ0534932.1 Flp pilus assembly protein TadG [Azospirillum picis]
MNPLPPAWRPLLRPSAFSILRDRRGAVSIETAILMPTLFLMVMTALDVARYARTTATLDRVAVTVADLATKCQTIYAPSVQTASPCNVQTIFNAGATAGGDLAVTRNGEIILSSVGWYTTNPTAPYGAQTVLWQQASSFTTPGAGSSVGSPGMVGKLPAAQVLPTSHNVLVAEVFFTYRPWTTLNIFTPVIRRSAVFRPRATTDLRTLATN